MGLISGELATLDLLAERIDKRLSLLQKRLDDPLALDALAYALLRYHQGVELIFHYVTQHDPPRENDRRDLMSQASTDTPDRPGLFRNPLSRKFLAHLQFFSGRCLARHDHYPLMWEPLRGLGTMLTESHSTFREEVEAFLAKIANGGHE